MARDALERVKTSLLEDDPPIAMAATGADWAGINGEIAQGAEMAALAAGLHHRAAAVIGEIEDEVAAISALLERYR